MPKGKKLKDFNIFFPQMFVNENTQDKYIAINKEKIKV